jgi:hypothetical protein
MLHSGRFRHYSQILDLSENKVLGTSTLAYDNEKQSYNIKPSGQSFKPSSLAVGTIG